MPSLPRVLAVDPVHPAEAAIREAALVLRTGGLVAMPTETVYGLAARAFDPEAVARIFAAKGRPPDHPLIAHVADETEARALAASWPSLAATLARAFWPGPLTLVVDRARHVPSIVAGGADSIAVRAPSHPVTQALLHELGEPVAAPSANRYQRLSPTSARHVVAQLGAAIDLVLDGGDCAAGIESTVLDIRSAPPRVLRPGAASLADLRAYAPDLVAGHVEAPPGGPRRSPGMDARHYAPRARLLLSPVWSEALALATHLSLSACGPVGLVSHDAPPNAPRSERLVLRAMPEEPLRYAHALYRTLHELDELGVEVVVVQAVPAGEAWSAVADRLARAATSPRD
jgi:L-threonylcarbamoyladenylate synthase